MTTQEIINKYLAHNRMKSMMDGKTCRFQDEVFYSYSTPIAKAYECKDGSIFIVVTGQKFSSTTTKQLNKLVKTAKMNDIPVYQMQNDLRDILQPLDKMRIVWYSKCPNGKDFESVKDCFHFITDSGGTFDPDAPVFGPNSDFDLIAI